MSLCVCVSKRIKCLQQEQEIEIEKYVDLAYNRENESPEPWPFSALSSESGPPFYSYKEFHLCKREPLAFPDYLLASRNYFDCRFSGPRRLKNVTMVMEWIPSQKAARREHAPRLQGELQPDERQALKKAFELFDCDQSHDVNFDELDCLVRSAMDFHPSQNEMYAVLEAFSGKGGSALDMEAAEKFLKSGMFRSERAHRYFVTVSLAEAETIRRIMHSRLGNKIVGALSFSIECYCLALLIKDAYGEHVQKDRMLA